MKKTTAKKVAPGRIRIADNSLRHIGLNKGDLCVLDLGREARQDKLCAAFTADSELVIRRYHREPNGDIRLTAGTKLIQVFKPGAVMIFGPVVRVLKGSAR